MFDFEPRAVRFGGDQSGDFGVFATRSGVAMGFVHLFEKGLRGENQKKKKKHWIKKKKKIRQHNLLKKHACSKYTCFGNNTVPPNCPACPI
jgi:hypothetical protein